jgi:hypothetical protein
MSNKLPSILTWLTVDPGRQYIGSFHPENPETWEEQAYSKDKYNMDYIMPTLPTFPSIPMMPYQLPSFGLGLGSGGGFAPIPFNFGNVGHVAPTKPACRYGQGCYRKVS